MSKQNVSRRKFMKEASAAAATAVTAGTVAAYGNVVKKANNWRHWVASP